MYRDVEPRLQNAGGILALGLLEIALVLMLAGIETVAGYEVLFAGQSPSGFLVAGIPVIVSSPQASFQSESSPLGSFHWDFRYWAICK